MKTIFDDGVLEATLYPNRWVFCRWVQNQHGRLQKMLIRDLMMIEKRILEKGWIGWFTRSEPIHYAFHKLLIKFGAMPREIDNEGYKVFVKPILKEGDKHVRVCPKRTSLTAIS